MSLRSWFRGSATASSTRSTTPQPDGGTLTPAEQKIADIEDAMQSTGLMMNDDPEGAEARLLQRKDPTAFHQLGLGVTAFMRSILGFEKEVMAEAANRLYECESKAWAAKEKAERKGADDPSQLFPAGSEYSLIYAESLLMNAIVSVLHESLTDALKGFYKLRKAYLVLDKIIAAQDQILKDRGMPVGTAGGAGKEDVMPGSFDEAEFAEFSKETSPSKSPKSEDEDFEFVDASERLPAGESASGSGSGAGTSALDKKLADLKLKPEDGKLLASTPKSANDRSETASLAVPGTPAAIFTNPVDAFIRSGSNMCFGILLLMISMIPPAFSRLLSIIGFRGDRERGVGMLWESTVYPNVNGAVAGMMLLGYYNGMLGSADVLPSDADIAEMSDPGEIVGYPKERCVALLQTMRERYPESRMWRLEEARILAHSRRVPDAIKLLEENGDSKMRQVAALNHFELAIDLMYMMDWPKMRAGFVKMIEMNDWSHALYYYIAACAELELYRDAVHALAALEDDSDEGEIAEPDTKETNGEKEPKAHIGRKRSELEGSVRQHKKSAEELFRKAPTVAGKKKFMARQMPFEVFVIRKIAKWEEKATSLGGIDLADAVGPSPAQEMIYMWNGPRRMTPDLARKALKGLDWARCTASAEHVAKIRAEPDEAAIHTVCSAAMMRQIGQSKEAYSMLEEIVEKHDRSVFKGGHKDDYVLPSTYYELGVLAWEDVTQPERWPEDASKVEAFRKERTDKSALYLETVAKWEEYLLDARFGMKVRTGLDSIRWLRRKKGWESS